MHMRAQHTSKWSGYIDDAIAFHMFGPEYPNNASLCCCLGNTFFHAPFNGQPHVPVRT